jgi:hypothetical protein
MGRNAPVWTDERLDDRFERIEKRFDQIDAELRALRGEIAALRRDMFTGFMIQTAGILGLAAAMVAHSL